MNYRGDIRLGDTIDVKFTTTDTSGVPATLGGTPAVSAYVGNSTTEITAGITLTVDFDARTGLHNVRVVASSGNGFATATNVDLVITAGTVGGASVVGYVIGSFSIENRSAVMPTTAGRTLDVSATGEAGIDWANIGSPTTAQNLSGTSTKAVEPTVAGRTLDVSATGEAGLDWANIGSPTTVQNLSGTTVKTATDVETDTQDIQSRLPAALTVGGNIKADALALSGDTVAADNAESFFDGTGYAGTNNVIPTVTAVTGLTASNLDATISSRASAASLAAVQADTDDLQTRLPAALVGGRIDASVGAMAANVLTAAATAADFGTEVADAIFDQANGVETGVTFRQALRAIGASAAGLLSGAATTTVTIVGLDGVTTRITATVDADGNRSAVVLSL